MLPRSHWTGRPGGLEQTVLSCDYNGWADVREEEREAIEAFEASLRVQRTSALAPPVVRKPPMPPERESERRAA